MNTDILKGLVPPVISRTFELMAIAEQVIASEEKKTKNKAAKRRIHAVFGCAVPGPLIRYTDALYRAHVQELCARAAKDDDLRLATKAEIVAALCEGSLLTPLNQQHTALYESLFYDTFGHYVGKRKDVVREPYEGATKELLHTLRHKFSKEERQLEKGT